MTAKAPPRVVLDTNVVLSALLFGGGPAGRVRAGWQSGRLVPLASTATAQELVRVLAYPVRPEQPQNPHHCLLSGRLPMVRVAGLRPNTPQFLANSAEVADGPEVPC